MEGESRKNTRLNIYTDEEALQVNISARDFPDFGKHLFFANFLS